MMRFVVATLLVAMAVGFFLPSAMALERKNPSVIIVGAGISGIAAAKKLSDAGINDFLILEATDRIGGRMKKTKFSGLSVEVGANWVEGVGGPKMNPIWDIVKNKLKLRNFYSDYDNLPKFTYKQDGGLYDTTVAQTAFDLADELEDLATNISLSLPSHRMRDISTLTAQRLANHVPTSPLDMAYDYYTYDYEYAEPPRVTSLQGILPTPTFKDFGDDLYFVADPRGYESVVYYLAHQFLARDRTAYGRIIDPRLKLNKVVREIKRTNSGVTVKTEDGSTYSAGYVMVSASIGVLQSGLIDFVPDLPAWKLMALYKFDMCIYTKIFLKFPYKFWPTGNGTEFFLYAHERRGYYTIWQQLEKEYPGAHVLLVTVTDDESRRIEQQPDSETKAEVMGVLRKMFGHNIPDATDILVPKWWSNRFYKGSYSNWPIGVNRREYDQIRAPIGRVYFTGEHTSRHYNGYVHGGYLSGYNSANMLISCIKNSECRVQVESDDLALKPYDPTEADEVQPDHIWKQ